MRGVAMVCVVFSLGCVGLGTAGPPLVSPRPSPRIVAASPAFAVVRRRADIRPRPRQAAPGGAQTNRAPIYALAHTPPVFRSPRPIPRPDGIARTAPDGANTPPSTRIAAVRGLASVSGSVAGSVCGDRALLGEVLSPIHGKLPGCEILHPVRINTVDGIRLSQAAILDCTTAKTLSGWVQTSLEPTLARRGGGVAMISVVSHYSCRTRNSTPGAKLSEHAKGHAIDISAFTLRNGAKITVKDGWRSFRDKRVLKKLHDSACGPFGTVLGPDANRFHQDHFHFDTARYRGGPFCE